jgi:hypothetical protein
MVSSFCNNLFNDGGSEVTIAISSINIPQLGYEGVYMVGWGRLFSKFHLGNLLLILS